MTIRGFITSVIALLSIFVGSKHTLPGNTPAKNRFAFLPSDSDINDMVS